MDPIKLKAKSEDKAPPAIDTSTIKNNKKHY